MPTMGFTLTDPDAVAAIQHNFQAAKGTAASSGVASSITVYMAGAWAAGENAKSLLYDSLLNLLGITETSNAGGAGWHTFNFVGLPASPELLTITAGQVYYFGVIGQSPSSCYYSTDNEAGGNGGMYTEGMLYGTIADPIGAWDASSNTESILAYCTYAPAAPANPLIGKPLISPDMIKKAKIR